VALCASFSASDERWSNTIAVVASSTVSADAAAGCGAVGVTATVLAGDRHATPTPIPPPCDTRVNVSTFWWTPSSATSKSGADRSVTGRPFLSRTTTSTRIAVVVDVYDCRTL
jgi:hypothetical protein